MDDLSGLINLIPIGDIAKKIGVDESVARAAVAVAVPAIVGGLAARGADPVTAVLWGVYLHGEAGRTLATRIGRVGFLARELLDLVPALIEGR